MAKGKKGKPKDPPPPPVWREAWDEIRANPVLSRIAWRTQLRPGACVDKRRFIEIGRDGNLRLNVGRVGAWEWKLAYAHALLHLGYGHHLIPADAHPLAWNLAADVQIQGLLNQVMERDLAYAPFPMGACQELWRAGKDLPRRMRAEDWERLLNSPLLEDYSRWGGGELVLDPGYKPPKGEREWTRRDWQRLLAEGLRDHAADAIESVSVVGWREDAPKTKARLMMAWFMANFPLMSSLAAGFKLVEDEKVCRSLDIEIAAVSADKRTIYINPRVGLSEEEIRHVIAHEILHVALLHFERLEGRDPYIWNIAGDCKISQWLDEMRIGKRVPGMVRLPEFDHLSTEEIYAQLAADVRRTRKLLTLRGGGLGDIIGLGEGDSAGSGDPTREDWIRQALVRGLELHHQRGRGDLPADFLEEVEHIAAEPVAWDAQLAEWFQRLFPPRMPERSYGRASRRQSSTPDIARPGVANRPSDKPTRVFAVLLDTSASMSARDLGQAIGTIVAYSIAHEVEAIRLVDCDAEPYDRGWIEIEALLGQVEVHGRGGTTLQPGLDLLESLDDLPPRAPVMILTDGAYEAELVTEREHCYVLPASGVSWWPTKGPVFRMDPA